MKYLKYLLFIPNFILALLLIISDLAFTIISVLMCNWWIPRLAVPANGWLLSSNPANQGMLMLPAWLKWFDTFDATTDAYWADGYVVNPYTSTNPPDHETRVYFMRKWLNRNTGYGWSYWVEGRKMDPTKWTIIKYAAPFTFFAISDTGAFNINAILFGKLRLKFGWKAWNYIASWTTNADGTQTPVWKTESWGPEWRIPFVFSISLYNGQ